MEFLIRVNVTDPMSADALLEAKKSRKMAAYVEIALVHFARTDEGRRTLAILNKKSANTDEGAAEKTAAATIKADFQEKSPKNDSSRHTIDLDAFLRF